MKIFNLATYNRPHSCLRTLESIYDQADIINLVINCGWAGPSDPKINVFHKNNDLGACYKFLKMEQSTGYYFTVDDDILYPPHYSEFMIERYHKLNKPTIITLHGRKYKKVPIQSYYNSSYYSYHVYRDLAKNCEVHIGGTGVMMINTHNLKIPMSLFSPSEYRMADLCVARFAKANNIPIVCLRHTSTFVQQQSQDDNIFNQERSNDKYRTQYFNKYIA